VTSHDEPIEDVSDEAARRVRALEKAVSRQLMSDVPLGAFSGGPIRAPSWR
jgi:asparagine synthetase B (glutamine-hydrolysing)